MTETFTHRLLVATTVVSALLLTLAYDADKHRVRARSLERAVVANASVIRILEDENAQQRDDHALILEATIGMWQEALHLTEEDGRTFSRRVGHLEDELERRTEDLMVCDLQLGGRDWDQAILDVCGPPLGYCSRLLDACQDDLVGAEARDQGQWDALSEFDRVSVELDACLASSRFWNAITLRETSLLVHHKED